jgi:uracil-DNA glycosylase
VTDAAEFRRQVARFVHQRREAGMPDLVLDQLDRDQVRGLLQATPSPRPSSGPSTGPRAAPAPGPPGPSAAQPAARAAAPDLAGADHDALRELALACTRCRLSEGRTQAVFSDGNPQARLMVVGEAPGANEDRTGVPFVGAAGKLLDLMLASVDLSRQDSVYICNVIKCRPPGNRNPQADEIAACAPYLHRQIELVRPEAILAVGTFAAQLLTGSQDALGKVRGSVYSYDGVPLVVTYHPAALLRNPGWSRPTWDDLQLLRQVLDGA